MFDTLCNYEKKNLKPPYCFSTSYPCSDTEDVYDFSHVFHIVQKIYTEF